MVRSEQPRHAKRFLQSALEQGIRDEFKFMLENDEDGLFNLLLRDFGERSAVGGVVQPVHGVEQCSFAGDEFTCGIELRVGIERIHESAKTFKEEFTAVTQIGSSSCAS